MDLVGWSAKIMVRNGESDTDAIKKIKEKYLGLNWLPPSDVFMFRLEVNLNPKVRKVRPPNSPNITLDSLDLLYT